MVKSDRVGTFLYRSIVEAHPDIVVIPVMPSIEQRIGVIWKKGKYQNATTEKVIKFQQNHKVIFDYLFKSSYMPV